MIAMDYKSVVKDTLAEFVAGKWPYSINGGSTDFSEDGEFGKLGSSIEQISKAWKKFPADKKHKILDYIKDLNNPEITRLLPAQEVPICPPLPDHLNYPPELAANACQWLDDYILFSKKWSPRAHDSYHECIAMALLSTVAGRRVSLSYGDMEYTPLFVALVGPTTLFVKSTTLKLYNGLLHAAGLDWMLSANIITPQKLLSNMAGRTLPSNWEELDDDQQTRIKKRLSMAAQVGWCYDEFGMQLDSMVKENGTMAEFKGLLRLLHDCKPVFEYDTHRRGLERIEKPYLSLVASLTLADIRPHAEKGNKFYRDGLFARFLFSCPPKGTKSKRTQFPKEKLIYPAELIMPLVRWHQWLGEPEIDIIDEFGKDNKTVIKRTISILKALPEQECILPDAIREHIAAYENALKDMMEAEINPVSEDLFGSYGRFHMQALHICMILASIDNQGYIELRHWARARQFIENRRLELHGMYIQTNAIEEGYDTKYDVNEEQLENEIIRHMERLEERGEEWITANKIKGYMKVSREKIANKLKILEKLSVVEKQAVEKPRANQAPKYRLLPETE